jgi:hypothetical protein
MTHRSPLVTLAGLVVAFVVMFGVNLASSPSTSYGGTPSAPPSLAATPTPSTPATSETPSATPTPSSTPSPSATKTTESSDQSEFPRRIVYAGRIRDGSAAVAVAVLGDQVAAYLCDGRNVETWLRGTVHGDELKVKSRDGSHLEAGLDGERLRGKIKVGGGAELKFTIRKAQKPAGLYRAKGKKTTIGWIVLPDGSQVGVQTTGQDSASAPALDPAQPQVDVGGESLDAAPVTGDETF